MYKELFKDKLLIKVYENRKEMGRAAAEDIADSLRNLLKEKEEVNIMFAAAPSQRDVHEALREETGIDWSRVNGFHMDEYVGIHPSHPAGFRNFLNKALFEPLPFKKAELINGNADNADFEADRYESLLRENPMDICVMGVGENGHIAFNDPHAAKFDDKRLVKVVDLDNICRQQQVNDGCFESLKEVPLQALTVTIPGLLRAKKIFCIVPAASKAEAVGRLVTEDICQACPASILRTHGSAALYLDGDSAKYLPL